MKNKTGIELIAAERVRQIEIEGWMPEHDREHSSGEIAAAAGCYVAHALSKLLEEKRYTNQSPLAKFQVYDPGEMNFMVNNGDRGDRMLRRAGWKDGWPWDQKWRKPSKDNKIQDLIKAGALIAAEIDRLNSLTP